MSSSNGPGEGPGVTRGRLAPEPPGAERRRSQRILLNLEVDYGSEDTYLFAYITDMSAMGIFVRTNNPEAPGTMLNLRFTLPGDEDPLELEGKVMWVNSFRPGDFSNIHPGMGVRFVDMDQDQRRAMRRLVRTIAYLDEGEGPGRPWDGGNLHESDADES